MSPRSPLPPPLEIEAEAEGGFAPSCAAPPPDHRERSAATDGPFDDARRESSVEDDAEAAIVGSSRPVATAERW